MSGICGAVGLEDNSIDELRLATMFHHIAPSFFGDRNAFVDHAGVAGLGKLHLQEFSNGVKARRGFVDAQEFVAVVDGCVTNREDVISRLPEVPGVHHPTQEARAIEVSYHYYGYDLVSELDGPFAMALWDKTQKSLLLSRDRLGEKSLYYWLDPKEETIVFGSEIKSILAHPKVRAELDPKGLSLHLAFGYVPGPGTLYKNIHKLLPGERLLFDPRKGAELRRYWRLPRLSERSLDEGWCTQKLHELFMQALERYVDGCREIAVFLSGGIDSSILVLALRELGVPDISTFTLGFTLSSNQPRNEDLSYARLIAEHFGTEHHEVVVGPDHDPLLRLPRIIQQFDDLVMTPNSYSNYLLAAAVREAGLHSVVTGVAAAGTPGIHHQFLSHRSRVEWLRQAERCPTDEECYYSLSGRLFPIETQSSLLSGEVPIGIVDVVGALRHYIGDVESDNFFRRILFSDLLITAAEESARVLDKVCSLESISVRSPYMDRSLIEFSTQLPGSFDGGKSFVSLKTAMLKVFGDGLPTAVLERDAVGYPCYSWGNGELERYQQRLLSHEAILESGIFDPEGIQQILAEDRYGQAESAGMRTWALTQFSLWHQIHIRQNERFLTV